MALDLMAHSHAPCAEQASTWMSAPTHNCGGPDPPSLDQATKLDLEHFSQNDFSWQNPRAEHYQLPALTTTTCVRQAIRSAPPTCLSRVWGLNYQLFSPTGIFAGDGPSYDITCLIQPLTWEAYLGRRIIQMEHPRHVRREFRDVVEHMRVITRRWPEALGAGWTTTSFLDGKPWTTLW